MGGEPDICIWIKLFIRDFFTSKIQIESILHAICASRTLRPRDDKACQRESLKTSLVTATPHEIELFAFYELGCLGCTWIR